MKYLDLSHNKLKEIDGLTNLLADHDQLKHLSLSANALTEASLNKLPYLSNLQILGLFANNIDTFMGMSPLDSLLTILCFLKERYPCLKELYLLGNPLVSQLDIEEYRKIVQKYLPSLTYLDGLSF